MTPKRKIVAPLRWLYSRLENALVELAIWLGFTERRRSAIAHLHINGLPGGRLLASWDAHQGVEFGPRSTIDPETGDVWPAGQLAAPAYVGPEERQALALAWLEARNDATPLLDWQRNVASVLFTDPSGPVSARRVDLGMHGAEKAERPSWSDVQAAKLPIPRRRIFELEARADVEGSAESVYAREAFRAAGKAAGVSFTTWSAFRAGLLAAARFEAPE